MKSSAFILALLLACGCMGAKPKPEDAVTDKPGSLVLAKPKKAARPTTESISSSLILPATPEAIWPLLSKVEDWGAWNEKVTKVEPGSGLSPGAKIEWQYDEKDVTSTVVSVKEREELSFKPAGSAKKATLKWLLQPRGDGTTLVTLRGEVPYGTAAEVMGRLGTELNEWVTALKGALGK